MGSLNHCNVRLFSYLPPHQEPSFHPPIESACCDLQCTLELLQFNCMCWAKKERKVFCLTPYTPFSLLRPWPPLFCRKDYGPNTRDAKEIHFAVSEQILKVEMVLGDLYYSGFWVFLILSDSFHLAFTRY